MQTLSPLLQLAFPGKPEAGKNPYAHIDVEKLTYDQLGEIICKPGGWIGTHLYNLQREASAESSRRGEESRRRLERKREVKNRLQRECLRDRARVIRAIADSVSPPTIGTLSGVAVPFETWGRPSAFEIEIVGVNAIDELIASDTDVTFVVDHGALVMARRSNLSLRLFKGLTGLRVEIDLPVTDEAETVAAQIEAGRAAGFSFGFSLSDSDVREQSLEMTIARYIRRLALSSISLTLTPNAPAYPLVGGISWKRK